MKKYKFKKLLNEYRALEKELSNVKEIINDLHLEFQDYYEKYCEDNKIDIKTLNEKNSEQVKENYKKSSEITNVTQQDVPKEADHRDVFKEVAKRIHPDKLKKDNPMYYEMEEDFKKANNAIERGLWGDLFHIADKYNVNLKNYDKLIKSLKKDIERVNNDIKKEKTTYSWKLFMCDENEKCKENVIKEFLKQLFNYKKT